MPTNDFLPFANGGGANVITQGNYVTDATLRANGFQAGTALSPELNKVWRQASIMAAVLAQFIVDEQSVNAVDDGTTATLLADLKLAVATAAGGSSGGFSSTATWQDVTGSRVSGTTYTNSTGKFIAVTAFTTNVATPSLDSYINGVWLQSSDNGANGANTLFFIVPPGATYKMISGTGIQKWSELS